MIGKEEGRESGRMTFLEAHFVLGLVSFNRRVAMTLAFVFCYTCMVINS